MGNTLAVDTVYGPWSLQVGATSALSVLSNVDLVMPGSDTGQVAFQSAVDRLDLHRFDMGGTRSRC